LCEIVFFPQIAVLSENAIGIIGQDVLKVRAGLDYEVGRKDRFCESASVLVFSTHSEDWRTEKLRKDIFKLEDEHKVKTVLITP
jgi:hypothetical protein